MHSYFVMKIKLVEHVWENLSIYLSSIYPSYLSYLMMFIISMKTYNINNYFYVKYYSYQSLYFLVFVYFLIILH